MENEHESESLKSFSIAKTKGLQMLQKSEGFILISFEKETDEGFHVSGVNGIKESLKGTAALITAAEANISNMKKEIIFRTFKDMLGKDSQF